MMRIPFHSFLTAFIANFFVTYVQPHDQIVHQAVSNALNDGSKIQESFQNLFNSVAKSDARKSEVYRGRLVKEAAKERQALSALKKQLQSTQNKNAQRRSSLYWNTINIKNSVLVKRDVPPIEIMDEKEEKRLRDLEDAFVEKYGNDPTTSGVWNLLHDFPNGDTFLFELAKEAHRKAGLGEVIIRSAIKESMSLYFFDPEEYDTIKIEVLVYSIEVQVLTESHLPFYFYVTKGLKPDCVHYLVRDSWEAWRLILDKHVCGIQWPKS